MSRHECADSDVVQVHEYGCSQFAALCVQHWFEQGAVAHGRMRVAVARAFRKEVARVVLSSIDKRARTAASFATG
jgi:hypothetical protein